MKSKRLLKTIAAILALALTLSMAGCNNNTSSTAESNSLNDTSTPIVSGAASEYEWTNVQIVGGGYTPEIIYNPTEEGLVYARTDIGGAYRMNKETGEWIPLTDQFGNDMYGLYGIDGMASDPVEPNRVYCLAGMYTNGWANPANAYVLCSEDYGDTWSVMTEMPFASGGNEPNRSGDRIVIDPNDNKTIYVGSRMSGLFVSHDYGKTFEEVSSFPTKGVKMNESGYTFGITTIAFDPASGGDGKASQTIYCGTGDRNVFCSKDGGETWTELENIPKSMLPYHVIVSGDLLYIVMNRSAGPYTVTGGLVKRVDTKTGEVTDIAPDETGHGWGDLVVDPKNPDILTLSSIGKWGAKENDNLYRSVDGGKTWKSIFTGDGDNRQFSLDISQAQWLTWGNETAKLGWMMGNLSINPFNGDEIMYGTGATIFKSLNLSAWDKGETVNLKVQCKGLEETAIFDLVSPKTGDIQLYSAMGDIDGFSHADVNTSPTTLNDNGKFGSTTSIACAFNKPEIVARCGNGAPCIGISTDSGKTWKYTQPKGSKGDSGSVTINCDGTAIYWTNSDNTTIFASYDLGENWTALDKPMATPELATDNFNPDVLYAFTGGIMYLSKDKGKTFELLKLSELPEGCKLVASPDVEGEMWCASGYGGVYKITNFGESVERMGMQAASQLAFGAKKEGSDNYTMYTLGEIDKVAGVYRSLDMGVTWERINDDDHQFGATGNSLAADYNVYGQLYFGTNGRGIIMGRIKS